MKTNFGKYVFILIVIITLVGCSTSKLTSEEKEAQKEEETSRNELKFSEAKQAIYDRNFVMEADKLITRKGQLIYVSYYTNFVSLIGDRATVQFAVSNFRSGQNGLGGLTVEGIASGITTEVNKKGNIMFSMNVTGNGISSRINIELYEGSDEARVQIIPNFSSNTMTLSGRIVPAENSEVYKGKVK